MQLFWIILPLICGLLATFIQRLLNRRHQRRIALTTAILPIPLILSTIMLSYPYFKKTGWFLLLAICLWGIIWALTRFYYDHELFLKKFLRSWWRFVLVMSATWYLTFLIITLI